jgi:hypothetical protein
MKRLSAIRATPAIAAGIVGLLIGGGGYAIAAGGGGKVNACVDKANGDLYVKSKCQHGDRKLSWSKVGPRGAAGARGATGAKGATGAAGAAGAAGGTGPAGPVKLDTVTSAAIANPAGQQTGGSVSCPAGEFATGGGISGSNGTQSANASYPLFDPATGHDDGWNAFMNNTATGATAGTFHVYVICTPATSVTP